MSLRSRRMTSKGLKILLVALAMGFLVLVPTDHGVMAGGNCSQTSVGLTPLPDLAEGFYQGFQGGLYPGGSNVPPAFQLKAGVVKAQAIVPLDANGAPNPSGKYVLLSIGMSNARAEFGQFEVMADGDPEKDPHLVIVNGATSGCGALSMANQQGSPFASCWGNHLAALSDAGVTPQQVVAVWIKEAESNPTQFTFPEDAQRLQQALDGTGPWHPGIIPHAKALFPNLRLVYLSSRIYAGYATTNGNPEPWAYQTGFAVKWLVGSLLGSVHPWVGWGPYLWADGLTPRSDGLTWACDDFEQDGTHPSTSGSKKVGTMLLEFFKTDPTAQPWFLKVP